MLHSQVPLVVAGGRCRSGASRERGYEPCTQDAASRSAYGTSPEDALDERDAKECSHKQEGVKLIRRNGHKSGDSTGSKCEFAQQHTTTLCPGCPKARVLFQAAARHQRARQRADGMRPTLRGNPRIAAARPGG